MGNNLKGSLGIGNESIKSSLIPCLVESIVEQKASKISCGYFHTAIATESGDAYTWGDCENGATGAGIGSPLFTPKCVNIFKEKRLSIKDISCGSRLTAFITCKSINS